MHSVVRKSIFLCLILLLTPVSALAQWEEVTTLLGQRVESSGTAITYSHGDVWAGYKQLILSSDDGETWEDRTPSDKNPTSDIVDIDFFDRNTGIILLRNEASPEHLYYTTDRGLTWTKSLHEYPMSATFLGSREKLVVTGNEVSTSHDAGVTWTKTSFAGPATGAVYLGGSKAAAFVAMSTNRSFLILSSDDGLTWTTKPGQVDYDCYDMVYDSCSKLLFVPNEEWWVQGDTMAEAMISSNEGTNWSSVCSFPITGERPPLTGAVDITPRALYAHSGDQGVLRSVDQGLSWQSLGGPNGAVDARSFVAAGDDLMFAISENGSLWRTRNSGGFPLPVQSGGAANVSLSLEALFTDSIAHLCAVPIVDEVPMIVMMCTPVAIRDITISGENSASFELEDTVRGPIEGELTIRVLFTPQQSGHYTAVLRIEYEDGTSHTIDLLGTADLVPISVTASISDFVVDTLGEAATIELTVDPPDLAEDVIVHITYDPALSYAQTLATDGSIIHGLPSSGSFSFVIPASKLRNTGPDAVIVFDNVTTIPKTEYEVRLDSLYVTPLTKGCYTIASLETSQITVPEECGTTVLSQVLRNEKVTISVNHHRKDKMLNVKASHAGHYSISLIDMLGSIVLNRSIEMESDIPETIAYGFLPQGTYLAVVRGNETTSSHRVQIVE